ncbi:MAG: Asp-tRNA(Asn)/Glu-tRNA(Gln) amidotransferase subunit GatC [Verrucomicrobia bacterium]|nr:Asp-tRNA(Asn)/Glu-tRNA(Gln) amidotransferase subunit GatC [Verrucomicrobiota bacterium]
MARVDIDIQYVARLARLELTAREETLLREQLGDVLGYVEKLKELEVSAVEPMSHAVPTVNVTRPDEVRPSLPQGEALRNAPAHAEGLFIVPKIVE